MDSTTTLDVPAAAQEQSAPTAPTAPAPTVTVAPTVTIDLDQLVKDFAGYSAAIKTFTDASKELQAAGSLPTSSALQAARDLRDYATKHGIAMIVGDLRKGNGKGKDKAAKKAAATQSMLNEGISTSLLSAGVNKTFASQASRFVVWVANQPLRENLVRGEGGRALAWKAAYAAVERDVNPKPVDPITLLKARIAAALAEMDDDTVNDIVDSGLNASDIMDCLIREAYDKRHEKGAYAD